MCMIEFNHISIVVRDLEKSKRFYQEVLGLEVIFEEFFGGEQFARVTGYEGVHARFAVLPLPGSSVIMELVEFYTPDVKPTGGFRHIAFAVDDVDKIYGRFVAQGVATVSEPVTISDAHPKIDGKRFFYFRDPDGNLIELFQKKGSLYSAR